MAIHSNNLPTISGNKGFIKSLIVAMETKAQDNEIRKLNQLNDELENYFRSTIIPQLFFDKDLILRKYSPAALKQFNLKETDIGKHLEDISNNLRYVTLEEDINTTIASGKVLEKEIQTTDEKWYRMNILPYIQRKDNQTNGVIITFVDINNYILTLKEFQKVNSEHELFIFTVSHDLKGPLHNIEGLLDTLKDSLNQNNVKERDHVLSMLKSSTMKMKEMISDLAKISKAHSPYSTNKQVNRFQDILDEVILMLKEMIDKSRAQIKTDFQIAEINFSRKDLRSILYNLLSNAIKYKSENRDVIVNIKTQLADDFILLSVQDNGRGIEEDKKGIIFSQFTRVLDNVEGTGIGLYLVSQIVNAQGGKIIVNSKVNEGAEFQVYLK